MLLYLCTQEYKLSYKDMSKKSRCPKNYALSEQQVAEIIPCSTSLVKKVRSGDRSTKGYLAATVLAIDEIANNKREKLIENLKSL